MHLTPLCQTDEKRKSESIIYDNQNKCGVDMLDSMNRQMSTKSACRRWTLAVFFNILDMTVINAWIIFQPASGSCITRCKFLFKVIKELTAGPVSSQMMTPNTVVSNKRKLSKRLVCQIKKCCKNNMTTSVCDHCKSLSVGCA